MANPARRYFKSQKGRSPLPASPAGSGISRTMTRNFWNYAPKMEQFTFARQAGNAFVCNGHSATFMSFRHRF